jgi:hypothetical protein
MIDKDHVLNALEELKKSDSLDRVFGAKAHEFKLHPPIALSKLAAFESAHGIQLPADYRHFVTTIGNGGAGPYYGLFPFGEHDDGHGYCTWECGYLLGDVGEPFPLQDRWNLPESFWEEEPNPPDDLSAEEENALWEAWDEKVEAMYWGRHVMNGAIPICHLGCALRQWLIVNGPCKGEVWHDDRADQEGVYPALDAQGKRHTFTSWYLSWLDEA